MRLDAEMVIRIHDRIIAETGGSPGLENPSLLLSALGQPWQTFAGKDLYDTVWKKAAALCRSIACNHPFVDGNKRTALTLTATYLELNGHRLAATEQETIDLMEQVARGKLDVPQLARQLYLLFQPV